MGGVIWKGMKTMRSGDLADARASIERFLEKIYKGKRLHSAQKKK